MKNARPGIHALAAGVVGLALAMVASPAVALGQAGATVAAVAVTAAVIGSLVCSIPPSCSTVVVNGIAYSQCGSIWYQPQFVGTSTTYVVVAAPR